MTTLEDQIVALTNQVANIQTNLLSVLAAVNNLAAQVAPTDLTPVLNAITTLQNTLVNDINAANPADAINNLQIDVNAIKVEVTPTE